MRVAVLNDIHGNLPALDAVLDDVRRAGVDRIVVGGDVLPGAMVGRTLERLLNLDIPVQFIVGNGEVAVLAVMTGEDPGPLPDDVRELLRWTAEQFGPEDQRLFASWPRTVTFDIPGLGPVLFCHGTPRHENEIFTSLTPEERLLPVFDGLGASLVVCGHTHIQFDRMVGTTRVVNAGSVGMPFGKTGAYWLLLGPDVELRCTQYDLAATAELIRKTACPMNEMFANEILRPRSEQEFLALCTAAELKYGPAEPPLVAG